MNSQCSLALLESALIGSLPGDAETALQRHLDECEECSATLERMVGGKEWYQEAAAHLVEDELDEIVPARDEWSAVDFTVEHLEPSDEPNVLGRLGGYDVLEIIGHGGMGVVLKGYDRELKRCVAIKVLAPHLAQSSLARKRFAREAQAAAAVVHANVLAIHQVQPSGRLPFLVMPLVAGESLAQRLTAQGTLELKEILRIGMQAAAGLSAAHEQGLVHRDVKPANILLEKGVERAVLTDFGLARAADDATLTRWGIIAGTPQYMSPEQARGESLDGRSDLFGLGCVLYEMATGVSPFRTESLMATLRRLVDDSPKAMASLNPELPPWFIAIVERLLEKDPARRFSSAKEVSELLEGCLAHLQQPASVPLPAGLPVAAQPKPKSSKSRIRKVFGLMGILGLSLLGAVAAIATNPPDIAGEWSGDEWGKVVLKSTSSGEYSGSYSETVSKQPGQIELKWSRIERRFNGTWREGGDRFGELSVRLVDQEIRGALTTDAKSKINPATPRLADLTWSRKTVAADSEILIRTECFVAEVPADFKLTPQSLDRASLAQNKETSILVCPRIHTLSGQKGVIKIGSLGPEPESKISVTKNTNFDLEVTATVKEGRVEYRTLLKSTTAIEKISSQRDGTANWGEPVVFGPFDLANGRKLVGSLVFKLGDIKEIGQISFGPVIERTIPYFHAIDFLSGRVSEWPAEWRNSNRTGEIKEEARWIVDAGIAASAVGGELIGHGTVAAPCTTPFEKVTPEEVKKAVADLTLEKDGLQPVKKGYPITQFFRTRENGIGILQIIGVSENPAGVKIRYKLVQGVEADSNQIIKGANGTEWSKPNDDGLQIRATVGKERFSADETPIVTLDLRNTGSKPITYVGLAQSDCQVQVDGHWYVWPGFVKRGHLSQVLNPGEEKLGAVGINLNDKWVQKNDMAKVLNFEAGTHEVRIAFHPGGSSDAVSNPIRVEIEAEAVWGKPNAEGLQIRAMVAKDRYGAKEIPVVALDLRNSGTKPLDYIGIPEDECHVHVDGQEYVWPPPLFIHPAVRTLKPGEEKLGALTISLSDKWVQKNDKSKALTLASGKHEVRIAFHPNGAATEAISTPITIEIEAEWGKAKANGLQIRISSTKTTWGANEKPDLALDLRNAGTEELILSPDPDTVRRLELDGKWYGSGFGFDDGIRQRLKPGEERMGYFANLLAREWGCEKELTPGVHEVRIAWEGATSAPFKFIIQPAWGKPNADGLQIRISSTKTTWAADETPELALDLRNAGIKELKFLPDPETVHRLEIDGKWYERNSGVADGIEQRLKPGEERVGFFAHLRIGDWGCKEKLTPGVHEVRIAYGQAISGPFKLVIQPAWSKPNANGLQIRISSTKTTWAAEETPVVMLDLRNTGTKPVDYTPAPQVLCQLQVDGQWYVPGALKNKPLPKTLKPGEECLGALAIPLGGIWFQQSDRAALKLAPGTHEVRIAFHLEEGVRVANGDPVDEILSNPLTIEIERGLSEKTKKTVDAMLANIDHLQIVLEHRPQQQPGRHSLLLCVTDTKDPDFYLRPRVTSELMKKALLILAGNGFFDRARGDFHPPKTSLMPPTPKNEPGYILIVRSREKHGDDFWGGEFNEDLSQRDGAAVEVAKALRSVLDGEAAAAADTILREMGAQVGAVQEPQSQNFGQAIERVVNSLDSERKDSFIDLGSGRLFTPPKNAFMLSGPGPLSRSWGPKTPQWIVDNSLDVGVMVGKKTDGTTVGTLVGIHLEAVAVERGQWDKLTPADLLALLKKQSDPQPESKVERDSATADRVFLKVVPGDLIAFKTARGAAGLMEVLVFTDEPDGLKFRYKLMKIASNATPTSPEGKAFFGPVIDRVMFDEHIDRKACALNLAKIERPPLPESITVKSPRETPEQPEALAWARKEDVDLVAFLTGKPDDKIAKRGVYGFDLLTIPVENEAWDQMTPAQATERVKQRLTEDGFTPRIVELLANSDAPRTFLIQTRSEPGDPAAARIGLLQISNVFENSRVKLRYKLLQPVAKVGAGESSTTKPTPREIVAAWLLAVKEGRLKDSSALCTPQSHAGASVELLELLKSENIEPLHQLADESAAIVLCKPVGEDWKHQRVLFAELLKQDGQWRIQAENLVSTTDAYSRMRGFQANPKARFDVSPKQLAGRWTVDVCGGTMTLREDGTGTLRTSDPNGTVGEATDFRWSVNGDTLDLPWPSRAAAGTITNVAEQYFTVSYGNGYSSMVSRHHEPDAPLEIYPVADAESNTTTRLPMRNRQGQTEWFYLEKHALLEVTQLKSATVGKEADGQPNIQLEFNDEQAKQFAEITAKNIGKRLGFYVDGRLETVPKIQAAITGGKFTITGNFTAGEAARIAKQLQPK